MIGFSRYTMKRMWKTLFGLTPVTDKAELVEIGVAQNQTVNDVEEVLNIPELDIDRREQDAEGTGEEDRRSARDEQWQVSRAGHR